MVSTGMDNRKLQELEWHKRVLESNETSFQELVGAYHGRLVEHLLDGFGSYLRRDVAIANEAASKALEGYRKNPALYQPKKGSLLCFLQIQAVRNIQELLHREMRSWHFQHLDHVLAGMFDNEQDLKLSKLVLKQENNWCEFAKILDTGGLPIAMQLNEIARNVRRVRHTLENAGVDFAAMANRRNILRKKLLPQRRL